MKKDESFLNGYPIILKNYQWLYGDTKTPTVGNSRICGHCGKEKTREGHDGCLGTLPNIMNACCGHGIEYDAYVQFWSGNTIHGKEAIAWQQQKKLIIKAFNR